MTGLVMRESLRRAGIHIERLRFKAEARVKGTREDGRPDVYTPADLAAQRAIVKLLRKNFPDYGIVGEEKNLSVPCRIPGRNLWWTVDPLDGTSAFLRRQSHGIGSQIALLDEGAVIAAYVRDANTGETYGYHPGSKNVWRITRLDTTHRLKIPADRPLSKQYVLLRDPPDAYGVALVEMMCGRNGPFKSYDMADGSIGISTARLWKGEVGAVVFKAGESTPWDWAPVYGISRRLGFRFFSIVDTPDFAGLISFDRPIAPTKELVEHPLLCVHESRLDELDAWLAATYGSGVVLRR